MTDNEKLVTFSSADYDAIEAAVMETSRGRWFLKEFAKRNRNADTNAVLAALGQIEQAILDDKSHRAVERIRSDLRDMAATIARTKAEIGLAAKDGPDAALNDFLHAASEAAGADDEAFQALAEQRIKRILETLHHLESRLHEMMGDTGLGKREGEPVPRSSARPHRADEPALHPAPHPSFLM